MKTLSHLQNEAIERFDEKFEDVSIMLGGIWTTGELEIKDFLKTELETIVKESFKNTRVEELNETGINIIDGETVTIPLNIGYNSALSELKDIQNQFLNN